VEPPTDFEEPYAPMPPSVDFIRIVNNIMNALQIRKPLTKEPGREGRYESRLAQLKLEENLAIISDLFWFVVCKKKVARQRLFL